MRNFRLFVGVLLDTRYIDLSYRSTHQECDLTNEDEVNWDTDEYSIWDTEKLCKYVTDNYGTYGIRFEMSAESYEIGSLFLMNLSIYSLDMSSDTAQSDRNIILSGTKLEKIKECAKYLMSAYKSPIKASSCGRFIVPSYCWEELMPADCKIDFN